MNYFMQQAIARRPLATLTASAALFLSACSISDTPYLDTCQNMTGYVVGQQITELTSSQNTEVDNRLRVDIAFNGRDGAQTARCYFDRIGGNSENGDSGDFVASASQIELNGHLVAESITVKAALAHMKKLSIEGFQESTENLKDAANETSRRAKNVMDAAKGN